MAFTRAWDESDPANTNQVSQGAQEIREFKSDVRERLAMEHSFPSGDLTTDPTGMHLWKVKTLTSVDSPYTALKTDHVILCNCTGGAITVNLPAISGLTGKPYIVIKTDSSTNKVTIDASGSETINGATAAKTLAQQRQGVKLICAGSEWQMEDWQHKLGYLDHSTQSMPYTINLDLALVHLIVAGSAGTLTIADAYEYDRTLVIIKNNDYAITLSGINNDSPTLTDSPNTQDCLMLLKSFGKISCLAASLNLTAS